MKIIYYFYAFFILLWICALPILQWSVMETVNTTFMVGLIALLLAAFIKILQSGFLALFLSGFKKIGSSLSSNSNAMERVERQLKNDRSLQNFKEQVGKWLFHSITACAIVSLSLSVVNLVVYYS